MRSSWIEVELEAIKENVENIRRFLKPEVKFMATVKGNAYGHGLAEVSRVLSKAGVDAFGVAFAEEGIALREGGITEPILIYGRTFSDSYELLFDYNLIPNIFDIETAEELNEEAKLRNKTLIAHISVDTGLHRLGISCGKSGEIANAKEIIKKIMEKKGLKIEGIFSMFANSRVRKSCAYDDLHVCQKQLEVFERLRYELEKDGYIIPCWHIADSAGALLLPETQMNMVRIGSLMFGAWVSDFMPEFVEFKPAMSVHSRLACIREVSGGEHVGYNGSYVTDKPAVLGVVPFGTADGLSGQASGHSDMLIHGVRCPVVGETCMDQVILDISKVDNPKIGDEVVIIGKQGKEEITAHETAECVGAEDLEYLCRMNLRTPIYYV